MRLKLRTFSAAILMLAPALAFAQFSGVTNGPNTSTSCQASPGLYFDQQNGVLSTCGSSHTLQAANTTLGVFNAQTANATVTTAQAMATLALNANAQNVVGRTLRICASGIYTTPGTTAPTLTFSITEGGITPFTITTGATDTGGATDLQWHFCADITTAALSTSASPSTTGKLETHGQLAVNLTANTKGGALTTYADQNTAISSAINLFTANTLSINVAASATVTSVQLRQMTIQLVS